MAHEANIWATQTKSHKTNICTNIEPGKLDTDIPVVLRHSTKWTKKVERLRLMGKSGIFENKVERLKGWEHLWSTLATKL